ncbi:MAG: hypothetical protein GXP30_11060 [Verrucomicrobia bacterium]|nr:hypothetical protein [Verrucomicrobiota bacterium]
MRGATDDEIWDYAKREQFIVVSKDEEVGATW